MRNFALILALSTALAACSDDGDGSGSGGSGGTTSAACGGRAEAFSAGMSKMGEAGKLEFVLVDSNPAPPQQFDNVWTVQLNDASGAAVEGATLTVQTWMPDHEHGSPKQAVVTDEGGGKYTLEPVNLFMPGYWEVTIGADAAGETDSAVFKLCIGE